MPKQPTQLARTPLARMAAPRRWSAMAAGLLVLFLFSSAGWSYYRALGAADEMTKAAEKWVASLDAQQQTVAVLAYDAPTRVGWHFIPKKYRKGLQLKHMTAAQRTAAHQLLKSCLSKAGYRKATQIMELEKVLLELQNGAKGPVRDQERYYFTVFGKPHREQRWGLSVEGHHLSLNFVVEGDEVVSSTPTFYATNPGVVKTKTSTGVPVGRRVLAKEETLAFQLVQSFSASQLATALIAEKAPKEIRAAGEPHPPQTAPEGIRLTELNDEQKQTLRALAEEYVHNLPADVARARSEAIRNAGVENVYFAWAGATKPGIGHYYRVQGPTFLIEFVNTQPDAAGNPANHIHCIWREMAGDFGLSAKQ